jgi:hypothetical protein
VARAQVVLEGLLHVIPLFGALFVKEFHGLTLSQVRVGTVIADPTHSPISLAFLFVETSSLLRHDGRGTQLTKGQQTGLYRPLRCRPPVSRLPNVEYLYSSFIHNKHVLSLRVPHPIRANSPLLFCHTRRLPVARF